jgi:hypothetical protein
MATNEITDGCGLSTEAVLPLNRKRRRVLSKSREMFSMSEGFYPLESIFLLLALMALARTSIFFH